MRKITREEDNIPSYTDYREIKTKEISPRGLKCYKAV